MEKNLKDFAKEFIDYVKEDALENNVSNEEQLTQSILEYIQEEGTVLSPELYYCYNKQCERTTEPGYYKITAFDYSESSGILDIFTTCYLEGEGMVELTKKREETSFSAAVHFLNRCTQEGEAFKSFVLSEPATAEVIETIHDEFKRKNIQLIRFFILSNGLEKNAMSYPQEVTINDNQYDCELHIWDINAVWNSENAGQHDGAIDIDFNNRYGCSIECMTTRDNDSVRSYLAIMPATVLAEVYKSYNTYLLNKNVRNYLGGHIKVNKRMAQTLRENPSMFFAYNNGISSTADSVTTEIRDGKTYITAVSNWQIVNGGQTTNTICNMYKQNIDLKNVDITLKISEINITDDKIKNKAISDIARFANSQTQIKDSDLAANINYMLRLDEVSRSEWTPIGSKRSNTQWFFERMRGQYDLDKGKTRTKQKEFTKTHPKKQRFTKTDISKWEMAWRGNPEIASKGGEQSFNKFYDLYLKNDEIIADKKYFHHLIAKAILYQFIGERCKQKEIKGYVNIISNYVLATISWKADDNLDLDYIWQKQDINPLLMPAIDEAIDVVNNHILNLAERGLNPSVLAKKTDFWNQIRPQMSKVSIDKSVLGTSIDEISPENIALKEKFYSVDRNIWLQLSKWGKETKKLSLLERKKLDHTYSLINNEKAMSISMIKEVLGILKKSKDFGFVPQPSIPFL